MKLLPLLTAAALAVSGTAQATTNNSAYQQAKHYVYEVFPPSTRDLMFKVLDCETGHTFNPSARNRSGAMGYFEIMDSHNGTTYSYNGISITVDKNRLLEPLYNTLVAYLMSHGGVILSPWYSSSSCWS